MTDDNALEILRKFFNEAGVSCNQADNYLNVAIADLRANFSEYKDGTLCMTLQNFLTPEQAIAATLGSNQEANLGDALNEVAEKWAEAQVSAEEYVMRCRMLESLVRDMFAYIDNCCESDLSFECVDPVDCAYYDKARDWCTKASSLKQRMKELGIEVIDR